jgi:rare lipoprotein A (peptidoglycan hydrolase)
MLSSNSRRRICALVPTFYLALFPAQAKEAAHQPGRHAVHPSTAAPMGGMVASVYSESGRVAAGAKFNPNAMTVAHRTLPFGTRLVVSYEGSVAEVVVNDRGPFVRGRDIDLSSGVARALHFSGLGKVMVSYWPPVPRTRPDRPIEISDRAQE